MQDNRDNFTSATKELLARRVGYRCSNPHCRKLTCGAGERADDYVSIGVAAHICAAASGGPRYDAAMTPEMRKHISNGIWLCQSCARLVDRNEMRYTVDVLRKWKMRAEAKTVAELEHRECMAEPCGWLREIEEDLPGAQDFAGQLSCLIRISAGIDELVRKLEQIQTKVNQAVQSDDKVWRKIYEAQFDTTLWMLNHLNRESFAIREKMEMLQRQTREQQACIQCTSAPDVPVTVVTDVSGSMANNRISYDWFADSAQELLRQLRENWVCVTQVEEFVEQTFRKIDRIKTELAEHFINF